MLTKLANFLAIVERREAVRECDCFDDTLYMDEDISLYFHESTGYYVGCDLGIGGVDDLRRDRPDLYQRILPTLNKHFDANVPF